MSQKILLLNQQLNHAMPGVAYIYQLFFVKGKISNCDFLHILIRHENLGLVDLFFRAILQRKGTVHLKHLQI